MNCICDEMPTRLIKRKRKHIEVVPKADYDELEKLYNEVVSTGYDLLAMIDERDEIIREKDTIIERLEWENVRLKGRQTNKALAQAKKFDGAVISFDPKTRSLGVGLRFKSAEN